MLTIRLQRAGRKNLPHYRVVLAEHSAPVKGKYIQKLGSYNPLNKKITLSKEDILNWLNKGAKPSNTLSRLLIKEGVKHKQIVYIKKTPKKTKEQVAEKPEVKVANPEQAQEIKTEIKSEPIAENPVVEQEKPAIEENKKNPPAGGKE